MSAATFVWTNSRDEDGSVWLEGHPVVGITSGGELLIAPPDFDGEIVPVAKALASNEWIAGVGKYDTEAPRVFQGASV